MRTGLLLLFSLSLCFAADRDPTAILLRLRDKVIDNVRRIPNYTCVQTIDRNYYRPTLLRPPRSCDELNAKKKQHAYDLNLATTDRLRLEVAVGEQREMYSWVGASSFDDRDLDELVGGGPIGTGSFSSFLMSIFGGDAGRFAYVGDKVIDGRDYIVYTFRVPAENSHYQVRAGDDWVVTAYDGTIVADPRTYDLVRLTIRTSELPPGTNSCESTTTLDYTLVKVGAADFLLPKESRQRTIGRPGFETENVSTFSACREYRGESTLKFGPSSDSSPAGPQAPARPKSFSLPPDLPVTVDLLAPVDSATAAAGDPVKCRLANPIRDSAKNTLVPEGAIVEGRIMRVQWFYSKPSHVAFAMKLETVEVNGVRVPLAVIADRPRTAQRVMRKEGLLHWRPPEIPDLPLEIAVKYAIFQFQGERATVPAGFRSDWLTTQ